MIQILTAIECNVKSVEKIDLSEFGKLFVNTFSDNSRIEVFYHNTGGVSVSIFSAKGNFVGSAFYPQK